MVQSVLAAVIPGVGKHSVRKTPALFLIHPSHSPPSHFPQGPPTTITKSKGNYLKVAQKGTADSGGRNRGGTGGAQQAWSLPEVSKGAPGRGGDTQWVGLRCVGCLLMSLSLTLCHYLGLLPWGPLPSSEKEDYRLQSPFSRHRAEGTGSHLQLQATGTFQPPSCRTAVYRVLWRGKIREGDWVEARYVWEQGLITSSHRIMPPSPFPTHIST